MVQKIVFVGTQYGDEGKGVKQDFYVKQAVELSRNTVYLPPEADIGKIAFERYKPGTLFLVGDPNSYRVASTFLADQPSVWTMRWQGGGNAGHTVVVDGVKYALHQVPSGILIRGTYNLMGEGVFLEPRSCLKEIEELRKRGIIINKGNFGVASNAHVTLDYNIEADAGDSRLRTGHTSTGRGIKPTAVDKYGRVGIRFEEMFDLTTFTEALKLKFPNGMPNGVSHRDFALSYLPQIEGLREYSVLQENLLSNQGFNFGFGEGAQGFLLDIDRGLYPGVTSSNPSIPPFRANTIVGVVKGYASSIGGDRPFIGQMSEGLESTLRERWGEKGTTTGKPRNLGWLDIVALRHAIRSADIDCLVSTCGDRLEDLAALGEKPKLVVGYKINGKTFTDWDRTFHNRRVLYQAEPVFEELDAWTTFFDKDSGRLTENAQVFVDRVEKLTGTEFVAHGYGPGIDDVLEVKKLLKAA